MGTFILHEVTTNYLIYSSKEIRSNFFIHVYTNEVYGELKRRDSSFNESSCYTQNKPYLASIASSQHLVSAWCRAYGTHAIINYSSNYNGPY